MCELILESSEYRLWPDSVARVVSSCCHSVLASKTNRPSIRFSDVDPKVDGRRTNRKDFSVGFGIRYVCVRGCGRKLVRVCDRFNAQSCQNPVNVTPKARKMIKSEANLAVPAPRQISIPSPRNSAPQNGLLSP